MGGCIKPGKIAGLLFMGWLIPALAIGQIDGMVLFSCLEPSGPVTNLINGSGATVHNWQHQQTNVGGPQFVGDSTLFYQYRVENPSMISGGEGGGIQMLDWFGTLLWDVTISSDSVQHHHDAQWLDNGNILLLAWERKTGQEAQEAGRQTLENTLNQMWSEIILEVAPVYPDSYEVVWAWHLWDHLIQDADSLLPNYGQISQHPERMNINFGTVGGLNAPNTSNADWLHFNSLDYNPYLDQILISARNSNEIYIIDHSTTTEQAAGHSEGNHGRGGNFLYRWGNPEAYGMGDSLDQKLFWNHEANWIDNNCPDSGKVMIFNNGYRRIGPDYSSIEILVIPDSLRVNNTGTYDPPQFFSTMVLDDSLFITRIGGAFQLPDGSILASISLRNRIIEFDPGGGIVWQYETYSHLSVARKYYHFQNTGLEIKSMPVSAAGAFRIFDNYPNPFNPVTQINYYLFKPSMVNISIYDLLGRKIKTLVNQTQEPGYRSIYWNATNDIGKTLGAGIYVYQIQASGFMRSGKMVLLK